MTRAVNPANPELHIWRQICTVFSLVTRRARGERLGRRGLVGRLLRLAQVAVAVGVDDLRPLEPQTQQRGDRRHE